MNAARRGPTHWSVGSRFGRSIGLALCLLLILGVERGSAQVIAVEPVLAGKAFAADTTRTFLWEGRNARATLVFIPGGEGRLGLTADRRDLPGFYANTLKALSDPALTAGAINVAVFDSPAPLAEGRLYPSSRAASDHLMRLHSVVLFYREKFGKPVWLMGHSNGAASATEFYKYLQKRNEEALIAGMIYSSGRNGSDFNARTTGLPVLFLAHRHDGCPASTPAESKSVFERLKRIDTARVEYVTITGGTSEGDPCRSGYHMFYGASAEAYRAIDSFIGSFYR